MVVDGLVSLAHGSSLMFPTRYIQVLLQSPTLRRSFHIPQMLVCTHPSCAYPRLEILRVFALLSKSQRKDNGGQAASLNCSNHSRLIRASSPMPHSPPSFPCFCSCNVNSAPRPLASSSLKTTLDLLVRSLSATDRSVFRLRIKGDRKKDLEDVECTDWESSPALEAASSKVARSAMDWSTMGMAGSDRMDILSLRVL